MDVLHAARRAKIEKALDKPVRLDSGIVMTRRQWLEKMAREGATLRVGMFPKVKFSRAKFNRLEGQAHRDYEQKTREMVERVILVTADDIFYDKLAPFEIDYFKSITRARL